MYSMLKKAGEGWTEGLLQIKIIEIQHHEFNMVVSDSNGTCYSKKENNTRVGYLFDQFMYFASLETISLDAIVRDGFTVSS
jgi:hypothetical protein